jgi:hypothetical protein
MKARRLSRFLYMRFHEKNKKPKKGKNLQHSCILPLCDEAAFDQIMMNFTVLAPNVINMSCGFMGNTAYRIGSVGRNICKG